MSDERVSTAYEAVKRAIDGLGVLAKERVNRVQRLDPGPVLRLQPPQSRVTASVSLNSAVAELEVIAEACRKTRDLAGEMLAEVERSKHECQFALAPVSSLPDEMLVYIVSIALPHSSKSRSGKLDLPPSISCFTQVCSGWRRAISSSSSLWAEFHIHQHISAELMEQHSVLSKGKRRRLVVSDEAARMPFDIYRLGSRCLDRVDELSWRSSVDPWTFLGENPETCQSLKSFSFKPDGCPVCYDGDLDDVERLGRLRLPELLYLSLQNMSLVEIETIHAPQLVTLDLSSVDVGSDAFSRTLSSLPTLQKLSLRSLSGVSHGDAPMAFTLPHLHTLATSNLDWPTYINFLHSSRYPALRRWEHSDWDLAKAEEVHTELARHIINFIVETRTLEHIKAYCHFPHHRLIFAALDPEFTHNIDSIARITPRLRHSSIQRLPKLAVLDLSVPRSGIQRKQHELHEVEMLKGAVEVLQHRKERSLPTLEALSLYACPLHDKLVVELASLVTRLAERRICDEDGWLPSEPLSSHPPFDDESDGEDDSEESSME